MNALDLATGVLFALGALLSVTGSVGIVRMPDFYSRLHPAGKTDTAGQFLILGGLVLQAPDWVTGAKLLLIIALLAVSAPTASHAITKAAWLAGLRPWTNRLAGHELLCPGSLPLVPDIPAETTVTSAQFAEEPRPPAEAEPAEAEPAATSARPAEHTAADGDLASVPGSPAPDAMAASPEGATP